MRVERLGEGPAEVAVVGGIHGDEPCGVEAIDRLVETAPDVERPVLLVVANEEALRQDVRYVEEDLNRAFPPMDIDPATFEYSDTHEGRLARELRELLADKLTLSIHSTQSYPDPFGVVVDREMGELDDRELEVCTRLPVEAVVDSSGLSEGRLLESVRTIEVEAGYQKSEAAAENAVAITRAFLRATGVLAGETEPGRKPLYRLVRRIPKPRDRDYEVFVENFERIGAGETFAAVDGDPMVAERAFYPVLFSEKGYDEVFGYAADRVGIVTEEGEVATEE